MNMMVLAVMSRNASNMEPDATFRSVAVEFEFQAVLLGVGRMLSEV